MLEGSFPPVSFTKINEGLNTISASRVILRRPGTENSVGPNLETTEINTMKREAALLYKQQRQHV